MFDPFRPPADPLLDQAAVAPAAGGEADGGPRLTRLQMPLLFSGCSAQVIERFGGAFSRFGLVPLAGGGGGSVLESAAGPPRFEEGSPVAAQLDPGRPLHRRHRDHHLARQDRVLAFGHPFLQFGPVEFPMTAAEIVTVLPNLQQSFKLSNSTGFMGTITADHPNGVMGVISAREPALIPFDITLDYPDRPDERYHYELVRHKSLSAVLGTLALFNSLTANGSAVAEQTLQVAGEITLQGISPVRIDNMFAGAGAASQLTVELQTILQYLYQNFYGPAEVERMRLEVKVSQGFPRAAVSEVYLDRSTVHPGDTVRAEVVLEPAGGARTREQFSFVIPQLDEDTRLLLLVGAGDQLTRAELQLSPTRFLYTSLDHLVRLINRSRKNNNLYFKVLRQDQGVIVGDREMPGLPSSAYALLKSNKTAGALLPLNDTSVLESERPTGYLIQGFKIIPTRGQPAPLRCGRRLPGSGIPFADGGSACTPPRA